VTAHQNRLLVIAALCLIAPALASTIADEN
jgi:hypothetical protein